MSWTKGPAISSNFSWASLLGICLAFAMAVSRKTGTVFVTGTDRSPTASGSAYVYTTIAYNG